MVLSTEDFGWFSPVDLDTLFIALAKLPDPSRVVLVGGQALAFWVDFFNLPAPETGTPYLTQDADFLGMRQEAQFLAKQLGANISIATLEDSTPNSAVLSFIGHAGQRLLIDFLSTIVGLNNDEMRRLAVPFEYHGQHLYVLHPLMSLESRFHNLHILPSKREANGIAQARIAVEVAKQYVETQLLNGEFRLAYKAAQRIANLAQSKAGKFVWQKYGIDPLVTINPDLFPRPEFKEKFWLAITARVSQQRNRLLRPTTA